MADKVGEPGPGGGRESGTPADRAAGAGPRRGSESGGRPLPPPLPDMERRQRGSGGMAGMGFQFAAAILLFVFAGQWVDSQLGTTPWGVLVGVFVGFAAGLYSMVRAARRAEEEEKRD